MAVRLESGHFWTMFGSIVYGGGHYALYLPLLMYDLAVLVCFPLNWLITFVATHVLGRYEHESKTATHINKEDVKQHILSNSTIPLTNNQLLVLFDSLPVASTHDMLGYWTGRIVRSGSLLDVADKTLCKLQHLGFSWGKRYRSPFIGDPLVLSFLNRIHVPIIIWGNVQLNQVEYRGKSNATMVYDNQPWQDYFRILDDGSITGQTIILGVWASRHQIGGWFTLTANASAASALAPHHRLTTPSYATISLHPHGTSSHVANVTQQLAAAARVK